MCWSECYFNKVKCEQKKNQIVKLKFFFFQKPFRNQSLVVNQSCKSKDECFFKASTLIKPLPNSTLP